MTTTDLDALIARRDALKINIDSHLRYDPSVDAPGDALRDELQQTIGAITELLHEPFRVESERLASMRAQIAQELLTARHQRTQLRCRLGAAQGARSTMLADGDDATEHHVSSKRLSLDLEAIEEVIGHLEARLRGVDGQLVALTEAESINITSGVSAA